MAELLRSTHIVLEEGDPMVNALAVALFNHANMVLNMSSHDDPEAVAKARELCATAKQVELRSGPSPRTSPILARVYLCMAGLSQAVGEHSRGSEECQQALDIEVALRGPTHHYVAMAWNMLGSAQVNIGDFEEGLASFDTAVRVYHETLTCWDGPNALPSSLPRPQVQHGYAMALNNLGATHLACKEYHLAKNHLVRCLVEKEALYGPADSSLVATLHSLSQVHEALGEDAEAQDVQERVAQISQSMVASMA